MGRRTTICIVAVLLFAARAGAQVQLQTVPSDHKRPTVPVEGPVDPVFRAITTPYWAIGGDLMGGARLFDMRTLRGPAASTRTQAGGYSLLARGGLTCARIPLKRDDGATVLKDFGNGTKALLIAGFIPAVEVPVPIPFAQPGKLLVSPVGAGLGIPFGFDPLQYASSRAIHAQAVDIPWAKKKNLVDRGCDAPRDADEKTDPIIRLDEALRYGGVSGRSTR
ncbi:hypothetical protein [Roseiterribacter gracilis]|uniref:Uncharacterized protein n=1 Tax=Roseiterribacter gracilis TaxID=2812848 RepID=A0A8S8XDJ0_9PROT|nr:hypothetical protein TMPK1_16120 [Rhodospirillales bacterium TMPK1]